ncbi:MAG: hypothetical protein WBE50_19720, partial [Methyloceanibacter sp.]
QGLRLQGDGIRQAKSGLTLSLALHRRNGLLFLPPDQVARFTELLSNAQPLLSGLVRDPSANLSEPSGSSAQRTAA